MHYAKYGMLINKISKQKTKKNKKLTLFETKQNKENQMVNTEK